MVANCPKLVPLSDGSLGSVTLKLVDIAKQYYKCRAAAGVKDEVVK